MSPGKRSRSRTSKSLTQIQEVNSKYVTEKINEAINALKKVYDAEINALKAELVVVKESQSFICEKYDCLKESYDKLLKENKELKSQSKELKNQSESEVEKLDCLEQYGRRQNLEIVGIPVQDGENTNAIVIEVAKLLDVSLTPEQISTSLRLPAKNPENRSPPIIARFTNRDVRNKIYANRKATRTASLVNFSVPGTEKICVNENLTRPRKKLFWLTKQKAKKIGFKYLWTTNGNIFVKQTDQAEVIAIKNEKDVDLMVNEDTANNS